MTAAIAACTEQYLEEKQERNYKKLLFENAKQSYEEKMFLLYSMDISGIQNFYLYRRRERSIKRTPGEKFLS